MTHDSSDPDFAAGPEANVRGLSVELNNWMRDEGMDVELTLTDIFQEEGDMYDPGRQGDSEDTGKNVNEHYRRAKEEGESRRDNEAIYAFDFDRRILIGSATVSEIEGAETDVKAAIDHMIAEAISKGGRVMYKGKWVQSSDEVDIYVYKGIEEVSHLSGPNKPEAGTMVGPELAGFLSEAIGQTEEAENYRIGNQADLNVVFIGDGNWQNPDHYNPEAWDF